MRSRNIFLALGIVGLILIPGGLFAQLDWVSYSGNPVIDENFDPASQQIFRPSVIFRSGKYYMWYGKSEAAGVEKMGYATSLDGIDWTLVDAAVLAPSSDPARFDSKHASQGWIIADGDTLKMWYWGDGPNIGNIGYAWSTDGINWTKVDGPGIDGSVYDRTMDGGTALALAAPCVVKDGDTYRMWYTRVVIGPYVSRIAYATSHDGINWTNVPGAGTDGAVLDWGNPGSFDERTVAWPAVIKTAQGFEMWYDGVDNTNTNRLGFARSPDGVNWTRVIGNGTNGACFDEAPFVSVFKQDDIYKMWYGVKPGDVVNYATSMGTGVKEFGQGNRPTGFVLGQNYPNPFNPSTTIRFNLPTSTHVTLKIYNTLGQEVRTWEPQLYPAGEHTVMWDGADNHGLQIPGGVYFFQLKTSGFSDTKKMLLLR